MRAPNRVFLSWTRNACLAMTIVIAGAQAPAWGCGLCITPRGGLSAVHPKSLGVAIAIRRDIDAGRLSHKEDEPTEKAEHHDRDLQTARIVVQRLALREGFQLLLIEDGSHYRIEGSGELRREKKGDLSTVRWVTGRDVMVALLQRRLTLEAAIERGLIVIEDTVVRQGSSIRAP